MTTSTFDNNILIGGEAGQGMQTLGILLTHGLLRAGYSLSTYQSYQSRIRGGHNYFQIRLASQPVHSMTTRVDLLVALNAHTVDEHCDELTPNGIVLLDSERTQTKKKCGQILGLEVSKIFPEARTTEILINSLYLGAVAALLGCPPEPFQEVLGKTLAKKGDALIQKNLLALKSGHDFVRGSAWKEKLYSPMPAKPDDCGLMIHGNQAIALGALAAGCKFYTAYPMTPATTILETLAKHMAEAKVVVEQAEDEIAALNMVLGASYAGVRAMTGTSGGGFALMAEALSLCGIIECPAVIALSQRPGPATGLPTRTEQGDLEFVVHAGHGEFPRVVLSPGNHSQCFDLTVAAFNLADRYQIPAFIVTDQYLADLYSNTGSFDLAQVKHDRGKLAIPEKEYARYQLTPDGVSPRAFPGKGPGVVIVDSDEHTEDGHLTEDLEVRKKMNEKRLAKTKNLMREMIQPEIIGHDLEHGVLCWGSSLGPCLDAVQTLQSKGKKVSLIHFRQVWPLNKDMLVPVLSKFKQLTMVEGNATGQFARLLHSETSISVQHKILKYDGKPFFLNELIEELDKIV